MCLRRKIIPTAAAITAATISNTIGLSSKLPEESPPPDPSEPDDTGTAVLFEVFAFFFFFFAPPLFSFEGLDSVVCCGTLVVPVSCWALPPPEEWCTPDCGSFGRYSSPDGPARAEAARASDIVAAAISAGTVLDAVMQVGETAKILPSPPD
jgi:hypothetical protein